MVFFVNEIRGHHLFAFPGSLEMIMRNIITETLLPQLIAVISYLHGKRLTASKKRRLIISIFGIFWSLHFQWRAQCGQGCYMWCQIRHLEYVEYGKPIMECLLSQHCKMRGFISNLVGFLESLRIIYPQKMQFCVWIQIFVAFVSSKTNNFLPQIKVKTSFVQNFYYLVILFEKFNKSFLSMKLTIFFHCCLEYLT